MSFFFFFFPNETNETKPSNGFEEVQWQHSANKGEWSELFALYKLIVDQNLYPINNNQSIEDRLRMPILSILRHTDKNLSAEYKTDNGGIVHIKATGCEVVEIDKNAFEKNAYELLDYIKKGADEGAFDIPTLDAFRKKTFCPKIKCYSKKLTNGEKDKSDLYLVIHDALTGQTPKLGFSIKSELGNPPTLLNATKLTNFRYKLSHNLSETKVNEINAMLFRGKADIQGRVRAIINEGSSLVFDTINPDKNGSYMFLENLILIDSFMPNILAHLLVLSYTENTRLLDALTDKLTLLNPLNFPMKANKKYYEAKVKRFITDVALGMLPSQPWEGSHQAAGVLVVKDTGIIDCYHVIYKDSLDDYLYHDLKFETPMASRHNFGRIETDNNGNQYFTLNLQLRFLK